MTLPESGSIFSKNNYRLHHSSKIRVQIVIVFHFSGKKR